MGWGGALGHFWWWAGVVGQSSVLKGSWHRGCGSQVGAGVLWVPGVGFWVPVAKLALGDGVLGWGRCPGSELVSRAGPWVGAGARYGVPVLGDSVLGRSRFLGGCLCPG